MRVFIGTHENCGIITALQSGFRELGCEVTTVVKHRDKYFPDQHYNIDLTIKNSTQNLLAKLPASKLRSRADQWFHQLKCKAAFGKLKEHDLYLYIWDTLLPDLGDLEKLKKKGKKTFFLFIGSEVRYAAAYKQQFPDVPIHWGAYYEKEDLDKKLFYIRTIEKHADAIFSVPDQAGLQVREFYHMHLPLDSTKFQFHDRDNEMPTVIHIPSNRALKGTNRILEAVERCRAQGLKFNFKLIENKPNSFVRSCLQEADVVVDQVYINGPGMLGLEAMASGCAVATKFVRNYPAFQPPACYVDHTDLLEVNLKWLISDKVFRRDLAFKSRKFIEESNQPKSIAKKMLDIYNSENIQADFIPEFFVQDFKLNESGKLDPKILKLNSEMLKKYYRKPFDRQVLAGRRLLE